MIDSDLARVAPEPVASPVAPVLSPPPSRLAGRLSHVLAAAWERGALPHPSLAPGDLIAAAIKAESHDDFGGSEWRPLLDALCLSLETEARLNPLGRAMAHGQLVKALRERLRAERLLRQRPKIADIPIPAPIIVLGSMRSGTTRVQRLLACDPRLAHTRGFESLSPIPRRGGNLRRMAGVAVGLAALRRLNPALGTIHPSRARAPEEEFGFFAPSLASAQFAMQWRVPGYARLLARADLTPAYAVFRSMLQINAAARRGRPARWVLKAPEFMEGLDPLLTAFPDACIIRLRRSAQSVVPSAASLIWQHRRLHSDHADPIEAGRDALALTRRRCEAAADARRRWSTLPQLDLHYDALDRDWEGEMQRVYSYLGLPLNGVARSRMAAYLARENGHAGHVYSAEQFGLATAEIAAALPKGA